MFHKIAYKEKYKYLSKESEKIHTMMDKFGLSLPKSCRFIAERTPSKIFSDFLDRFANSVDSGISIKSFLHSEQAIVLNDFNNMYKTALNAIDLIKEVFTSIVIAMVFIISLSIMIPLIIGENTITPLIGSILIFIGVEIVVLYFAKSKVPRDSIWHTLDIETKTDLKIKKALLISIFSCIIISIPIIFILNFPITISTAIILTPFIYVGKVVAKEENIIKRKDSNFAAFIRSLGSLSTIKGGVLTNALKQMTYHDFGPLTQDINELYKRTNTRINSVKSWDYFSAGTGSNLIEHFGKMFADSVHIGCKPDDSGEIISNNFMQIESLRKHRYNSASSIISIAYGLSAGISFTIFLTVSISEYLGNIFLETELPKGLEAGLPFIEEPLNIYLIVSLIMALMTFHALLSAKLIRILDGGHPLNIYTHFVYMVWISAICGEVALRVVPHFLG
jgi:flagellar protein FlaJ